MAIEYLSTENKPVEEIKVDGYKPQFSNDYYWNRVRKPKQEDTETTEQEQETEPETESVSEENTQGVQTEPAVKQDTSTKSKRYTDRKEFVKDLTEAYTSALKARGIDTAYAKMLVAQDALESGWGKHYSGNYNFGNIIVPSGSTASYTEGRDHDEQGNEITQRFRNYGSLDEWVNAKIDLLSGKRYTAFTGDAAPSAFYDRVKKGGYAVDKDYVSKMLQVYNSPIFAKKGAKIPSRFDGLVEKLSFAKLGTKLPAGNKPDDPLDRETAFERIPAFVEMQGKLKGNQYDGPDMYDYRYGKYDPETKHWYSRDPLTGMILKNPKHPTFQLEVDEAKRLGYKIYRDKRDGRLYERLPEEPLEPTFKETNY